MKMLLFWTDRLKKIIGADTKQNIEWLSPKSGEDYAEYRDQAFFNLLGIKLTRKKPKDSRQSQNPQWHALSRLNNAVIL